MDAGLSQDEVANTSRLLVLMQPPGPLSLVPSFAMMFWDVSATVNMPEHGLLPESLLALLQYYLRR